MKNKFKQIVKKIKNWLSSLSKWAKKNYKKLIIVFLTGLLLLCSAISNNCNKKTAKAQSLNSSSPVFVIPNLTLKFQPFGQCTTLPFFIGVNNGYPVCYRARTTGVYEERRFLYSNTIGNYEYYVVSDYEFLGYRYTTNINTLNREYLDLNYNNINGEVYFVFDNTICDSIADCLSYAVSNSSIMVVQVISDINGRSQLKFYINDSNDNTIFWLEIRYFYTIQEFVSSQTVPLFVSSNVSLEYVSQELLNQSYNNGYSQGFITGRQQGYDSGFNAGVEYGSNDLNLQPFASIVLAVTSFINMPIMGNVTIGSLLSIGFGLILFGFAIKIFMGG